MNELTIDPARAGDAFPPIHEGRYEVDPWAAGLRLPLRQGLVDAVQRCGVRLLRVGIGCWLPGHDPHPADLPDREWFSGSTLSDADDPDNYEFTHLDRNLDVCLELGVELLFCFDSMPRSLARPGGPKPVIERLEPYAPPGYTFPDGVRDAPTNAADVYAKAAVKVLDHIRQRGVMVRYVELWNEPDLPFFYSGTYAEYFPMYAAFAQAVSAAGYRVGGPSWAGALEAEEWLDQFLADCADTGTPLDFYSFHRYNDDCDKIVERCREIRSALDRAGFNETEAILDEWGYDLRQATYFGTVGNAAFTAACLMQLPGLGIAAQNHVLLVDPVKLPEFGRLHGLTNSAGSPNPIAYCLEAFERMQSTPYRIPTPADDVVLAGANADRTHLQVIVANPNKHDALELAMNVPVPLIATLRRLTPESYASGGWSPPIPIEFGDPVTLTIPPETIAWIEGNVIER